MNCLVCVSHVPDTNTKIQFEGKELNKNGVSFVPGPHDEYALSRAIEFKEKGQSGKTTVLCVGLQEVEGTLRRCLAVGADDGVRINAVAGDAYFVAFQIAEFVKSGGYELIMFGKETINFNGGMVAGMVAELLDLPCVNFVSKLEVNGNLATVKREIDGGTEVLECAIPLVVSCMKGISEWRIANLRGITMAKTKPIAVVQPVAVEGFTSSESFELPAAKQGCKMIEMSNLQELVSVLSNKGAL